MNKLKNNYLLIFSFLFLVNLYVFSQKTYTIKEGETLYSISREKGISVDKILATNPNLVVNEIKIGTQILIPSKPLEEKKKGKVHKVLPKETLYGISKMYNITIRDLKKFNPVLSEGLKIGQELLIPQIIYPKNEIDTTYFHKVLPKETLFSLLRKYQVEYDSLMKWNPQLSEGLKEGQLIQIAFIPTEKTKDLSENKPVYSGKKMFLTDSVVRKKELIKIALLAPFYIEDNKLRYNKKSDYATEFYFGAMMAIHQLSEKGFNIVLDVFDTKKSEETLEIIIEENTFEEYDFVVGPFYTNLSEMFAEKYPEVTVISPLSRSLNLPLHPNLIQMRPKKTVYSNSIIQKIDTSQVIFITQDSKVIAGEIKNTLNQDSIKTNVLTSNTFQNKPISKDIQWVFTGKKDQEAYDFLKDVSFYSAKNEVNSTVIFVQPLWQLKLDDIYSFSKRVKIIIPKTLNIDDSKGYSEMKSFFSPKFCMIPKEYEVLGYDVINDAVWRLNTGMSLKESTFQYIKENIYLNTNFSGISEGGLINTGVSYLEFGVKE